MLYEVDYAFNHQTVYTALIFADSVSECKKLAQSIAIDLNIENAQIFIEA